MDFAVHAVVGLVGAVQIEETGLAAVCPITAVARASRADRGDRFGCFLETCNGFGRLLKCVSRGLSMALNYIEIYPQC